MNRKHTSRFLPILLLSLFSGNLIATTTSAPPEIEGTDYFSQAELDQMLAPIALYPDALLSQVLMAATYPLEVVEASRWSTEVELEGEAAVEAAQIKNWDISIKALVAFPDLVHLMDEQLTWTRRLGDAFLLQEEQVMETVQLLRRRSLEEGNLESLDHLIVREQEEVIIVEPREVEVVYVPYYNTRYVYGDWWWYDYPPIYWDYPRYHYDYIGFNWSRGFRISSRFYFSFCDWHHRDILLYHHRWNSGHHRRPTREDAQYHRPEHPRSDSNFNHGNVVINRPDRGELEDIKVWNHSPLHRRGVEYRGTNLNQTLERTTSSGISKVNLPDRSSSSRRSLQQRSDTARNDYRATDRGDSSRSLPSSNRRYSSSESKTSVTGLPTSRSRTRYSAPQTDSRYERPETSTRTTLPSSRSRVTSSSRSTPTPPATASSRSRVTSSSRSTPPATTSSRSSSSRSYQRSSPTQSSPPRQVASTSSSSSSRSFSRNSSSRSSSPSSSSSRSYSSGSSSRPDSGRSRSSSSRSINPVPSSDR